MLYEKIVPQRILPDLFRYCPTMDLMGAVTEDHRIFIHRLNGQRVLGSGNSLGSSSVMQMCWKPDGRSLAVAWSDNVVRLINADSGRIAHQIEISARKGQNISCIGWGLNHTDKARAERKAAALGKTLDDLLTQVNEAHAPRDVLDLPRDLVLLDVEPCLPKLSILPSVGKDEDIFSSRASVDAMFHQHGKKADDAVDIMIVGFEDGSVHLSIYDSFNIGTLTLGNASSLLRECKPLMHASHPFSSTHALLAATAEQQQYVFVPIDIRFISDSGAYLSLLASKTTQLQNLLRYISQVQRLMQVEWQNAQDLPTKFLRNINKPLQEECQCDFITAAYHLVVTGNCFGPMREWLVDELAERGQKRWDKAITTGYETVRRLAHESLLPALDRCSIVVSRLRGLSKCQETTGIFGLNTRHLNHIFDVLDCLALLTHNILKYASLELRQFAAFSTWLRREIEVQATEASSVEEAAEKDLALDYAKVLAYIQGPMTQSRLTPLLLRDAPLEEATKHRPEEWVPLLYDDFKKAMKELTMEDPADQEPQNFAGLMKHLHKRCGVVFDEIAEDQQRNVMVGAPLVLSEMEGRSLLDMKLHYENSICVIFVVMAAGESGGRLEIHRISLSIENGVSSLHGTEISVVSLGRGLIKDAKFVDDEQIMILWKGPDASHLLSIAYARSSESEPGLFYAPLVPSSSSQINLPPVSTIPDSIVTLLDEEVVAKHSHHCFPQSASFYPTKLEINGRKGRRVVCVLAQDRMKYRIYDLDTGSGVPEGEANGDVTGEEEGDAMIG
ncbi:MAG: hypothetical protein M1817_001024 [Caeruleum heppii]|nr:MAG: hypothetical protein M1817_001024 [Caeruleum heppii]